MRRSVIMGTLAGGLLLAVPAAVMAATSGTTAVSAAQAGTIAVQAVGSGTVQHVSADTSGGIAVWDVHVQAAGGTVWDVKVETANGTVLLKKVSAEQPAPSVAPSVAVSAAPAGSGAPPAGTAAVSAAQAGSIAVLAVGSGTVQHVSADTAGGIAVWDVHVQAASGAVWDVKVEMAGGTVLEKKISQEQSGASQGESHPNQGSQPNQNDHGGAVAAPPGVPVFGVKYQTAPAGYATYVAAAEQAVGGTGLKWIKFQPHQGGYQANIKIYLPGRKTTKVKDSFTAQGTLISQRLPGGH